jgi:hypothetical protein
MNNNVSSSHHTRILDSIDINAENTLPSVVIETFLFFLPLLIHFLSLDILD